MAGGHLLGFWYLKGDGIGLQVSDLKETAEGGLVIAGSSSPDESGLGGLWIARFDATGRPVWTRKVTGVGDCSSLRIAEMSGGYVLATYCWDQPEERDTLVMARFSPSGEVLIQKAYTGPELEIHGLAIRDGTIILIGISDTLEKDLFLRFDENLTLLEQRHYSQAPWFFRYFGPFEDSQWLAVNEGRVFKLDPMGETPCRKVLEVSIRFEAQPLSWSWSPFVLTLEPAAVAFRELASWELDNVLFPLDLLGRFPLFCPGEEWRSCRELKASDSSLTNGFYPIHFPDRQRFAYCEMEAHGGGWMRIARHNQNQPVPLSAFTNQTFSEVFSMDDGWQTFSLWPVLDWSQIDDIGISWDQGVKLLQDFAPGELENLLRHRPKLEAWVR